jgi:hypothetical protein
VRCAHAVGRFPHLIVYLPFGDAVHVLAFMHHDDVRGTGRTEARCGSDDLAVVSRAGCGWRHFVAIVPTRARSSSY